MADERLLSKDARIALRHYAAAGVTQRDVVRLLDSHDAMDQEVKRLRRELAEALVSLEDHVLHKKLATADARVKRLEDVLKEIQAELRRSMRCVHPTDDGSDGCDDVDDCLYHGLIGMAEAVLGEARECPRCHGKKTIAVKHGTTYITDDDDEIASSYHDEKCPVCNGLGVVEAALGEKAEGRG